MQIQPIAMVPHNTSAASTQAQTSSASFDRMREEAKRSAQDARNAAASGDGTQAAAAEDKALKKACEGFEAMFLNMMYRQMRSTVHEGGLCGEDNATKIFEDMRDSEMTKQMAEAGGIGLGDLLYKQLRPQVEAKAKAQAALAVRRKEQQ